MLLTTARKRLGGDDPIGDLKMLLPTGEDVVFYNRMLSLAPSREGVAADGEEETWRR
jgi:hypothetical protein